MIWDQPIVRKVFAQNKDFDSQSSFFVKAVIWDFHENFTKLLFSLTKFEDFFSSTKSPTFKTSIAMNDRVLTNVC